MGACLRLQADVRSDGSDVLHWSTTADVEALVWVPHDPTCFMVSTLRIGRYAQGGFMPSCPLLPGHVSTGGTSR